MKRFISAIILIGSLGLAANVHAQVATETLTTSQTPLRTASAIDLQKDPLVAMYFSATLPGLGQIYTGDKTRGFLFMASVFAAFGAAYASYEPALLHLPDYDKVAYGGNGDGLLSTLEAQNWQDQKFQKTAFDSLSSGRKAGLVTGAVVGTGLYLWNIFDARSRAHEHNREIAQRRVSMGLDAGAHRVGLAVGVNF